MCKCSSAPSYIYLSDFGGDFIEYDKAVYQAFNETFAEKKLFFEGRRIGHKYRPEQNGKSYTYDHITSSDNDKDRFPDLRRYECIRLPGFIIESCINNKCDKLKIWKNRRGSHKRVLMLCETIDYLVVLEEREDYYIFWTAYPIEYANRKRKLLQEYENYHKEMAKAAQNN